MKIVLKPVRRTYSLRLIPGLIEQARQKGIDVNALIEAVLSAAVGSTEPITEAEAKAQALANKFLR